MCAFLHVTEACKDCYYYFALNFFHLDNLSTSKLGTVLYAQSTIQVNLIKFTFVTLKYGHGYQKQNWQVEWL